ncbi:hypothetical protein [Paraburkholderia strydomiana]
MTATQAITDTLPAHVIAAVTKAAGIAARRIADEFETNVSKNHLRALGIQLCHQQAEQMDRFRALKGLPAMGDRHPPKEQAAFLREVMVVALMEQYEARHRADTASVRFLTPDEESALIEQGGFRH